MLNSFFIEIKSWGWQTTTLEELDLSAIQKFDAIYLNPSASSTIIDNFSVLPTQVQKLKIFDSLFKENGKLFPRLVSHEALRQFLVHGAKNLDIREPAFLVGETPVMRILGSVLADMGFGNIFLVGEEGVRTEKETLKRVLFGVNFQIVIPENLTLQSVSASLLINTADLPEGDLFLNDLSYFNYMKPEGFVLDLNPVGTEKTLLREANDASLRVLSTEEYLYFFISQWLQRLPESSYHLSFEEIRSALS